MDRNFYRFGIFLCSLYIAISFFQAFVQFQEGARLFFLQAFLPWFMLVVVMHFAGLSILLKYYHYKKYRAAFLMVIVTAIISLCHFVITYSMLTGDSTLTGYYTITYVLVMATSILFALVLVFSRTAERPWLKVAGIFAITHSITIMATFIWTINAQSLHVRAALEAVHRWGGATASLILVLYIVNFLSEMKAHAEKVNTMRQRYWNTTMVAVGIIAFTATLFLGVNLVTNKRMGKLGQNKTATWDAERIARPFEARHYVNSRGDTLPYRLMKPMNYDAEKKYPLMVCLHHGGAHGTDNIIQVEGASYASVLSDEQYRDKYPAFIFVPQCPIGSFWGGVPNYPELAPLVFEAIDALEKEFSIDEKRRYVAGLSGGGYGSWHFICARPEMFAAAIPICGGGDPELAKSIADVPVWAFHGEKDKNVPVGYSRDMIRAIEDAGGDPKYTEFPGEGHNIWHQVSQTPGVLEWLFDQKRK